MSRKHSDDFSSVPEEAEKIRDKSNPAGNVYTIRSGDTLYVIAKQLKTKHNLPLTQNTIVRATTTVFDNGQVVIDYFTDIIPGGNTWLRVHAAGADGEIALPVLQSSDI